MLEHKPRNFALINLLIYRVFNIYCVPIFPCSVMFSFLIYHRDGLVEKTVDPRQCPKSYETLRIAATATRGTNRDHEYPVTIGR